MRGFEYEKVHDVGVDVTEDLDDNDEEFPSLWVKEHDVLSNLFIFVVNWTVSDI